MIYFLAPFFNEDEFLGKFIYDLTNTATLLFKHNYKIFLVDDGSQDNSLSIVKRYKKRYPINLISYKPNRGVDVAFKLGFKKILEVSKKGDLIITLESDNTSDLKIIPKFIDKINNGADIVLASCYAKGGSIHGTGVLRQIASRLVNFILYVVFPIKGVKTYSSFYRAYRTETLQKIWNAYGDNLIEQEGFVCMVEMLIKFSKLPVKIEEVPMILRWEGRQGKSKMKINKTILGYGILFKELFLKERFGFKMVTATAQKKWLK